jgi:hypothetical protein
LDCFINFDEVKMRISFSSIWLSISLLLLILLANGDQVYEIMSRPGRRYIGERGHVIAATKIQSTWRMFVAR